ncbi:MAG: MFS transporter, partial [Maricaulis sp.]|nr:MFS transporter [Maricaulis sp.]
CSLLPEENEDRVTAMLEGSADFKTVPAIEALQASGGLAEGAVELLEPCVGKHGAIQMTPNRTGTDGFYVCVMERAGE